MILLPLEIVKRREGLRLIGTNSYNYTNTLDQVNFAITNTIIPSTRAVLVGFF